MATSRFGLADIPAGAAFDDEPRRMIEHRLQPRPDEGSGKRSKE